MSRQQQQELLEEDGGVSGGGGAPQPQQQLGNIEVQGAARKVWLVKVPGTVARAWRPLCERSMHPGAHDSLEEDEVPQLGKVQIRAGGGGQGIEGKKDIRLVVPTPSGPSTSAPARGAQPQHQPQQQAQGMKAYQLVQMPLNGSMMAFSYKVGEVGSRPQRITAEGTADLSLNATPVTLTDEQGQPTVGEDYCELSKERSIKASTRTRGVRTYEDNRQNHLAMMASRQSANKVLKRKGEEERKHREENKRVRAEVPVLERELFSLFERQPHYTFQQLQDETKQPTMHLKEVLENIAVLLKRGQGKDVYELKPEYGGVAGAEEEDV